MKICTIRVDDKENGELINIYWNKKYLIDDEGHKISESESKNLQEAIEKSFIFWQDWKTFNCEAEY